MRAFIGQFFNEHVHQRSAVLAQAGIFLPRHLLHHGVTLKGKGCFIVFNPTFLSELKQVGIGLRQVGQQGFQCRKSDTFCWQRGKN